PNWDELILKLPCKPEQWRQLSKNRSTQEKIGLLIHQVYGGGKISELEVPESEGPDDSNLGQQESGENGKIQMGSLTTSSAKGKQTESQLLPLALLEGLEPGSDKDTIEEAVRTLSVNIDFAKKASEVVVRSARSDKVEKSEASEKSDIQTYE
ncbi:unnamed protein product, partial [Protopolystoma xenopodis]